MEDTSHASDVSHVSDVAHVSDYVRAGYKTPSARASGPSLRGSQQVEQGEGESGLNGGMGNIPVLPCERTPPTGSSSQVPSQGGKMRGDVGGAIEGEQVGRDKGVVLSVDMDVIKMSMAKKRACACSLCVGLVLVMSSFMDLAVALDLTLLFSHVFYIFPQFL